MLETVQVSIAECHALTEDEMMVGGVSVDVRHYRVNGADRDGVIRVLDEAGIELEAAEIALPDEVRLGLTAAHRKMVEALKARKTFGDVDEAVLVAALSWLARHQLGEETVNEILASG